MNTFDATLNVKQGFPVFSTHVEANHVQKTEDVYAAYKLTDEDNQKIHQMAADKRIGALLPLSEALLPQPRCACTLAQGTLGLLLGPCFIDSETHTYPDVTFCSAAAGQRICKSIAPSIYGHANIKTGIALAMFGGQVGTRSS